MWRSTTTGSRSKRRAMPTSASCRASFAISAARSGLTPRADPGSAGCARLLRRRDDLRRTHPLHDPAAQPQSVKGKLSFDAQGIRIDDMTGELGAGRPPGRTDRHQGLHDRRSEPDRDRRADAPSLSRRVPFDRRRRPGAARARFPPRCSAARSSCATALYSKRFEPNVDVFNLGGAGAGALPAPSAEATTLPVRFDIQVQAPQTLRVENNLAHLVASADLSLTGTYDRPVLLGRAEIVRARSSSKATATWSRAARSTFSIRARSSRSSTSRPRRACVSRT